jgi:DNA-binding LacI/PurR family transcriptional regulator
LDAYGIQFDPDLVRSGGYETIKVRSALKEWLAAEEPVEAIFAFDDDKAQIINYFLQLAGKRVPEDIALVGFDDLNFSQVPQNLLTTVKSPIVRVGEIAASQLVKLILCEPVEQKVFLPTEMVIRRTCGCAINSDELVESDW